MSRIGKALISAIEDARENGLVTLEVSPDVANLRKKLKLTQQKFGEVYRINPETIKKWEQHRREPDSISRAYLKCIDKNPELIRRMVNS